MKKDITLKTIIEEICIGDYKIKNAYDFDKEGNKYLSRTIRLDSQYGISEIHFDKLGNNIATVSVEHLKNFKIVLAEGKSCVSNRSIENYESIGQAYTRICDNYMLDGLRHINEKYISKSHPENNYINHVIYKDDKLISFVCNGEEGLK